MKMKYEGGIQAITVVLPDRPLNVNHGDVVEVTKSEADRLSVLPGWSPVKSPRTTTKPSSEEE